jgi:hypothetical protein
MKLRISLALAGHLLFCIPAIAQTPAPTTSNLSFSVGASALGTTSQATPATDVMLSLNAGFKGVWSNLEFRSDNLLSPGANLQYYGGGINFNVPKKLPGVLAPLSFYVNGTVGIDRIVPATGPSQAHYAFMGGGGLKWLTSSGVQIRLIEIDDLHTPGAPWGSNTPAISGGISYLFGHQ